MAGWTVFDTEIGRCAISVSPIGLAGVRLPGERTTRTSSTEVPAAARPIVDAVRALIGGARDDLRWITLDTAGVPEFDLRVYEATRAVGPGSTTTYGEIARAVGAAHGAQAVGGALGRNPWPIVVPCHRVLAADGKMTGFSAPGGTYTKLRLLQREGAGDPTLFTL
jgi:methylated-DNA-[protein]-cysteine S-methyltransferase